MTAPPVDSFDGIVGTQRSIPFICVDTNSNPVTTLALSDFTINPSLPSGWPPLIYGANTIVFQRNAVACSDVLTLQNNSDGTYILKYTPSATGADYIGIFIDSLGAASIGLPLVDQATITTGGTPEAENIAYLDQNYPTSDAMLVTIPNPTAYTIFAYNYSDWSLGRTDTLYAIGSSSVNSDGTWANQIPVVTPGTYTVVAVSINASIQPSTVVISTGLYA